MKISVSKSLIDLKPRSLVNLFIIDFSEVEMSSLPVQLHTLRMHNHVEGNNYNSIWFGGKEYLPIPVEMSGAEVRGDGKQLPRPRLKISNINGIASSYSKRTNKLKGVKVSRFKVFANNLDAKTWENSEAPFEIEPDSEAMTYPEVFYVNKIISESPAFLEVELASLLDVHDVKIPRRRMYATTCVFEYRNSSGCNYQGDPVADSNDDDTFGTGTPLTLSNRGEWNPSTTYSIGNFVYIYSKKTIEGSGAAKKKFFFVCVGSVTGEHPAKSRKWKMDACSLTFTGCAKRFNPSGEEKKSLPMGVFPALQRIELDN